MVKNKALGKKIAIVGATSGIGRALALDYLSRGNVVGIAGRRAEALAEIKSMYPLTAFTAAMDVQSESCAEVFGRLVEEMGGMDVMVYCAGQGTQNPPLDVKVEMEAVRTNVDGFMRITVWSFGYFKRRGSGHIVDISSVAGIRPLRHAPAYSATKKYQAHYMSCLAQKSSYEKLGLKFTTVFPGWIRTDMLKYEYPMVISLEKGTRLIARAIDRQRRRAIVPGRWGILVTLWSMIPNVIYEKM